MKKVEIARLIVALVICLLVSGADVFAEDASVAPEDTAPARVFDVPGRFGGEQLEVIKGDVFIDAPGVILRNVVIEGTLTVTDKVRTGVVYLEGVSLEKTVVLNATGNQRVVFTDSWAEHVRVIGAGHLVLEARGGSRIMNLQLNASSELVETHLRGPGFMNVSTGIVSQVRLSNVELKRVILQKRVDRLDMMGSTVIEELLINAPVGRAYLSGSARIEKCVFNGPAQLDGEGSVLRAVVNSENVRMVYPPDVVELKAGVAKPLYSRPHVEAFTPKDGIYDVALDSKLAVTFSHAVPLYKPSAALMLNLREGGGTGPLVPLTGSGSTAGGRTTVTVQPISKLKPGHIYSLSLNNVTGSDGRPIMGKNTVLFRTKAEEAPVITTVSPAHMDWSVPTGTVIEIGFNKLVRKSDNSPLTIDNLKTVISLKRGTENGPVETYDAELINDLGQTRIKLLTDYYLSPNTEYFITAGGLEDSMDQPLQGQKVFRFKTAASDVHPIVTAFTRTKISQAGQDLTKIAVTISMPVEMTDGRPVTADTLAELVELRAGGSEGHLVPFTGDVQVIRGQMIISVVPVSELTPGTLYYFALGDLTDHNYMDVMGKRIHTFTAE